MNARCAAWAFLLAGAGCATAPISGAVPHTVVVEGMGPDSASALADAQKRAVEKALGVAVAASTRVEGAIAVRRRIWADARGRVESWSVLADRASGGVRVIRIRAVVVRLVENEPVPPPSGTKVRIEAAGPAGAGLRRGFGARGYTVVDRGGEFVVKGRSSSSLLRDARTAPFVSGQGRVSVAVVDAATGGVVWERSTEAGGLDLDALAASARAVENAGEQGGLDAADGLSRILWNK